MTPMVARNEDSGRKLPRGWSGRQKCVGWVILAVYSLFLVYRALHTRAGGDAAGVPVWELQDSHRLVGWMAGLVVVALCELAYYLPVGFLTAVLVPRGSGWLRRLPISLPALGAAGAIASLVRVIETAGSWRLAAFAGLAFPLLGGLLGAWMGTTWLRGRRACLWFWPKLALLGLLVALSMGIFLWWSLEEQPLPFEATLVTSAEKRRLVELIRSKSPRSLDEDETHTLRLTEHDINVLFSWGLSVGSPKRKAKVDLPGDSASLSVSINVPLGRGRSRYLNARIVGEGGVEEGILDFRVNRCRLGAVELPRWLLRSLSPVVASLLSHDRRSKPFMEAIRSMAIEPGSVQCTYGRVQLPPGFREDLFGPTVGSEAVFASIRAQAGHLLVAVDRSLPSPPSFGMCFETAFALARDRSIGGDPVEENRAAIFALGVLLGHRRLEEFLGPIPTGRYGAARRVLRHVTLRGRSDWTKHFCLSAAIAILSDQAVSDAAGLLKEELDADIGGSGFSFSDLLADRAGTTFAVVATRDEASARAMQDRLVRGFRIDEFFPPAADLPEGIPDAELQSRYGGVGGELYRRFSEEIERRVSGCAAYH